MKKSIDKANLPPTRGKLEEERPPSGEKSCRIDPQAIQRTADLLLEINGAVEVRAIYEEGPPVIGRFDNSDSLVHEIMRREVERPPKIFIVNLHRPVEGIDCPNKFTGLTAIREDTIEGYSFILVDMDPDRPANTSSTQAQLDEAEEMCLDILQLLTEELSWPEPLITMSGNGFHLLFKVELPNSPEVKDLIHQVLLALAGKFNTKTCIVDTGNFDAARLWKLPGTMARKGEETAETPHRLTRFESFPDTLSCVTQTQLQELVEKYPPAEEDTSGSDVTSEGIGGILQEISEGHEYFVDPYGVAYVEFLKNSVVQTCPMEHDTYLDFMTCQASARLNDVVLKSYAIKEFIEFKTRQTRYEGKKDTLFIRNAYREGSVIIDRCDESGGFIKISPEGVTQLKKPSVHFRRSDSMYPLPTYAGRGNVLDISRIANIEPESDEMVLLVSFLMNTLFPHHHQPVLIFNGREGCGKTTATELVRALIDPSSTEPRSFPSTELNLISHARTSALLTFDNVSTISPAMSDCLCRLSTGGGYGTRTLYKTMDETAFYGVRPVVFNGIEALPTAQDLLDRTVLINLKSIPYGENRSPSETKELLATLRPSILGGLYEAVSYALGHLHEVDPSGLPRMADFARAAIAAEPVLPWETGRFLRAYEVNRHHSRTEAVLEDPVTRHLMAILSRQESGRIDVTSTELLEMLRRESGGSTDLPKSAASLGKHLARIQTALKLLGVRVTDIRTSYRRGYIIALKDSGMISPSAANPSVSLAPPVVKRSRAEMRSKQASATRFRRRYRGRLARC